MMLILDLITLPAIGIKAEGIAPDSWIRLDGIQRGDNYTVFREAISAW
jgi:hypothetical protein